MSTPKSPAQIVHDVRFEFDELKARLADLSVPMEKTNEEMSALCKKVNDNVQILPEDLKEELSQAFLRLKAADGSEVFVIDV